MITRTQYLSGKVRRWHTHHSIVLDELIEIDSAATDVFVEIADEFVRDGKLLHELYLSLDSTSH